MNKIILFLAVIVSSAIADLKDFPDRDAFFLAQSYNYSLLEPPKELYETIAQELAQIRKAYPEVAHIQHTPDLEPGKLICNKEFLLEKLNSSALGPIKVEDIGNNNTLITFTRPYNAMKISPKVVKEFGNPLSTHWRSCTSVKVLGVTQNIVRSALDTITGNKKDNMYFITESSDNCYIRCRKEKLWIFDFDGQKFTLKDLIITDLDKHTTPAFKTTAKF